MMSDKSESVKGKIRDIKEWWNKWGQHPSLSVDVQGIAFNDIHTLLDALTAKDREIEDWKKMLDHEEGLYAQSKMECQLYDVELTTLKSLCDELAEGLANSQHHGYCPVPFDDKLEGWCRCHKKVLSKYEKMKDKTNE